MNSAVPGKVARAKGVEVLQGWLRYLIDSQARGVLAVEPMPQLLDRAELGAATVASVFNAHDLECRHAVEGLLAQLRIEGGDTRVLREALLDVHYRRKDPVHRMVGSVVPVGVLPDSGTPTAEELAAAGVSASDVGGEVSPEETLAVGGGIAEVARGLCVTPGFLVEMSLREFESRLGHRWLASHEEERAGVAEGDLVREFMESRTKKTHKTNTIQASLLYLAFMNWLGLNISEGGWTPHAFGRAMTRLGYEKARAMHGNVYVGLCMIDENPGEVKEAV